MHIRLPLCTLTKLHYSQTTTIVQWQWFVLYTHTNLHYSQTIISSTLSLVCFAPLQNYTTLKLALIVPTLKSRFVPLQNYTTLKPQISKKNGLRTICAILKKHLLHFQYGSFV